ncbi:amino acid adenylation domain-containing protein [Streptomyces sp. NBC_01483]|uniref:amino acid adenylation domain-containing protein n=1 Tax=Streptomyces sp. NBC_01483 TaxID=2903883 RepID=UPI002E304D6D|nr:amino acid adenylation domain-containing protein [Streptomyces sp. NBC_01483]
MSNHSFLGGAPPDPYTYGERIEQVVAHHARLSPDAIAVQQSDETITYGALFEQAGAIASELRLRGVPVGAQVAVAMDRSIDLVAMLLGVLRAGAAYVAVDPAWPRIRIANVVRGTGTCLLVSTHGELAKAVGADISIPVVTPGELCAGDPAAAPPPETDGTRTASVFYTSGSTGRPKGALSPHRGTVRTVVNCPAIPVGADTVFLQAAPLPWDAFSLELWAPLLNGGRSVLLDRGAAALDAELLEAAVRRGVNSVWLTSSLFAALAEDRLDVFNGLRLVLTGGERVPVAAARRVLGGFPGLRLVNGYGPAESTIFATYHVIQPADVGEDSTEIPIGTALPRTTVLLLGPDGRPRPALGEYEGEIAVGGDGVALGYVDDPEETRRRFFDIEGERYYRTGDLARRDGNGVLRYRGRIDKQIKIRGIRIEPGEVEAVLETHPLITTACAVAIDTPSARRRQLVAAYTTGDRCPLNPKELSAFAATHLLGAMVPTLFHHLNRMPRNANGKTDRGAVATLFQERLAAADVGGDNEAGGDAPGDPVAEVRALLGMAQLAATDDLLEAGASSLDVIRLAARLGRRLDARLTAADIYRLRSVEAITVFCAGAAQASGLPEAVDEESDGPLSHAQQRFWLAEMASPGAADNTIAVAYVLSGPLRQEILAEALTQCVRWHPGLRTVYLWGNEGPLQRILSAEQVSIALEQVEMPSGADGREPQELAETLVADWWDRPFALDSEIPLRFRLCRLPDGRHLLCLQVHHIAFDGSSEHAFVADLRTAYEALCAGQRIPPHEGRLSYRRYAAWEATQLAEWADRDLPYWSDQLQPAPEPFLPAPTGRAEAGRREMVTHVGAETVTALAAACACQGGPVLTGLVAAAGLALARTFGATDLSLGSVTAGRFDPVLESTIGYFVNPFVVRLAAKADEDATTVLARTVQLVVDGLDHSRTPFDEVVSKLAPARGRHPFFQTFVVLQLPPPEGGLGAGVELTPVRIRPPRTAIELTVEAIPGADGSWTLVTAWREDGVTADAVAGLDVELRRCLAEMAGQV